MGRSSNSTEAGAAGTCVTPETGEAARRVKRLWGIPVVKLVDRSALGGIALGFLLVFQPWGGTLRSGFFVTAFATILHIVTSHMEIPDE